MAEAVKQIAIPVDTGIMKLYETLPDKSIIRRVNEIFYRKVYEHPWLSRFFKSVPEEHIRKQQTNFIVGAIGGPKLYAGRLVKDAHVHVLISEDLFSLRQSMLIEALEEAEAPASLREQWLKIDDGFKGGMVKQSISQCKGRFKSDKILAFEKPRSA